MGLKERFLYTGEEETSKRKGVSSMRLILDSIASNNRVTNIDAYNKICNLPKYNGQVDNKKPDIVSDKSFRKGSLIDEFDKIIKDMKLEDGSPYIDFDGDIVKTDMATVVLCKSLIAACISPCKTIGDLFSRYMKQLLSDIRDGSIALPITIVTNNKAEEVILDELNQYIIKYCNANNIVFSEVVDTKKKRTKKSKSALDELAGNQDV